MFAANQQQLGLAFLTCPRCTASLPAALLCVRQGACNKFALPHVLLLFFFSWVPHTRNLLQLDYLYLPHIFVASCQLPVARYRSGCPVARPQHSTHTAERDRGRLLESLLCAWPACKLAYRARNLANRRRLHFASCCCGMRRRHRPIPIRIRIGIPSRSHATASDHCVGS